MRQIAREMGHSRTTVKKAIESAEAKEYTLQQPRAAPVLGPYKARIDELLAENERLPRKQRYTGHKIYEDIYGQGYRGSESSVRRYIGLQRRDKKKRQVYMPLEFDPGTDAQVDWGEAQAIIAGEQVTVQLFLMRLCYSRKLFVRAYPTQRQEAFFEGHVLAFHHFEGIPHRLSYDNLKIAVQYILEGGGRQEQKAFVAFRSHYLFESHYCTPGQGHEKGRVEKGVGFARRNFMVPIPRVDSFEELNAHLLASCLADDERRVDRQALTIGEAWAAGESRFLRPLPEHDYDCCVTKSVVLNGYSQVEFETNRYSVPADQAYRNLVLKAYPFRVDIRAHGRRHRQPSALLWAGTGYLGSAALPAPAGAASGRFRTCQADPALAQGVAACLRAPPGAVAGPEGKNGHGRPRVRPHPEAAPGTPGRAGGPGRRAGPGVWLCSRGWGDPLSPPVVGARNCRCRL